MTAQDRVRRGPLAALLICLGLFLAAGSAAAAGSGIEAPAVRPGPGRHNAATFVLPSGTRNPLDDEASGGGAGPSVLPSAPGIVTHRLPARPRADAASVAAAAVPRPAGAAYRARAPPAS